MIPLSVQSILTALFSLLVGIYSSLPMVDAPTDAAAETTANQSVESSPTALEVVPVSGVLVETTPPPKIGEQSTNLSESSLADTSQRETQTVESQPQYTGEAIDYLSQVGFGVEYGASSQVLRRWDSDIRIKVHGEPTDADLAALEDVVQDLSSLVPDLNLEITNSDSNLDIHFLPESRFAQVEPRYVPVNLGFFRVWWDNRGVIYRGRILVSSEQISQQERSHLVREELTQSLGLFRDSWQYEDSIFYQGWTSTVEFSPLDRQIIAMHYSPRVETGMGQAEVLEVFAAD